MQFLAAPLSLLALALVVPAAEAGVAVARPTPVGPARAPTLTCQKIKSKVLKLTHGNATQNVAFLPDYHVHNYVGNVPVPGIDNPSVLTSTKHTKAAHFEFEECENSAGQQGFAGAYGCEVFGGTSHCYGRLVDESSSSCVTFDRVSRGELYLVARECATRDDASVSGQWWVLTSERGVSTLSLHFSDTDSNPHPSEISFYPPPNKGGKALGVTGGKVKEGAWSLVL